jgi:hypothetical protein
VVITKDGKVHNGSVRVERVDADKPAPPPAPAPAAQPQGFMGVFVPDAAASAPSPALAPEAVEPRAQEEAAPESHADGTDDPPADHE